MEKLKHVAEFFRVILLEHQIGGNSEKEEETFS